MTHPKSGREGLYAPTAIAASIPSGYKEALPTRMAPCKKKCGPRAALELDVAARNRDLLVLLHGLVAFLALVLAEHAVVVRVHLREHFLGAGLMLGARD